MSEEGLDSITVSLDSSFSLHPSSRRSYSSPSLPLNNYVNPLNFLQSQLLAVLLQLSFR